VAQVVVEVLGNKAEVQEVMVVVQVTQEWEVDKKDSEVDKMDSEVDKMDSEVDKMDSEVTLVAQEVTTTVVTLVAQEATMVATLIQVPCALPLVDHLTQEDPDLTQEA